MDIRLFLAILTGKSIIFLIRIFGGGATAAPGLIALKIDPNLVTKLSKKIVNGAIVVSGTNGKTTTSRLIYDLLSTKYSIIHNRQGSNLERGIASTLISKSGIFGNISQNLALWEVDEATLPIVINKTSPKVIILLNLFRDQLDRYGEVDTTRQKWQKSLRLLEKNTTLILNTDDPGISFLSKNFKGRVISFGVEDKTLELPSVKQIADVKHCPNCSIELEFSDILSSHLGHYFCKNCNFNRQKPDVSAKNIKFNPDFSTSIQLAVNLPARSGLSPSGLRLRGLSDSRRSKTGKAGSQLLALLRGRSGLTVNYNLPGLYNVYNVLAAVGVAHLFEIPTKTIINKIENFSTAFGRYQKLTIDDKKIITFLIKNPTGANEVLRVLALKNNLNLLIILNDKIADGKDVSWIWDTNWEILQGKTGAVSIFGTRRWDMATRLKYAEFELSKNSIYKEIYYSIENSLAQLGKGDTLIILPTYTALLDIQKSLHKLGGSTKWHEN